jgi:hypothetical protein
MGQKAKGPALGFAQRVALIIDERRKELGMTKAALIATSEIPANTFHTRMRGDRPFDLNDIEQLAAALGCEPELILREAAEGTAIGSKVAPITPMPASRVGRSRENLRGAAWDRDAETGEDTDAP